MTYAYYTLDVFTNTTFGGNPLAVFPDADGLSASQMQLLAKEFNLSECAFVLKSDDSQYDYKVRIFTPTMELPFAGHPTIGTAYLLNHLSQSQTASLVFKEGVGKIALTFNGDWTGFYSAKMAQSTPTNITNSQLSNLLQIDEKEICDEINNQPLINSCGVDFLCIPLKSKESVDNVNLSLAYHSDYLANTANEHLYVFTENDGDIHARMFAPLMGISEDPATGAAACALAGSLHKKYPNSASALDFTITQGEKMQRKSSLKLTFTREEEFSSIHLQGQCVITSRGEFYI